MREAATEKLRAKEAEAKKLKEAEEKQDKSREQLETRAEASSSPISGQKQGNKATPVTESESERERLKATVHEQQSLMLTLSAERQRIEAEKIAAEQTLNERLKEQKLTHDCEPLQEKSALGNNIDKRRFGCGLDATSRGRRHGRRRANSAF
jgi:hypothetical protein